MKKLFNFIRFRIAVYKADCKALETNRQHFVIKAKKRYLILNRLQLVAFERKKGFKIGTFEKSKIIIYKTKTV